MADTNKVTYGLSNVHYALFDENAGTYETPVALPGGVNLSLEQQGETSVFRADNIDYWTSVSNNGYEGDLEVAKVTDAFLTDVLKFANDSTTGLLYELANAQPAAFALLFQFEGDATATRHVMYNCKATRPSVASATTPEGAIEPQTATMSIKASARPQDNVVKARAVPTDACYNTFFTTVPVPTV